jgi:ammonium transporter, Amt family
MLPFVGVPGAVVAMDEELRQALLPTSGITANFPLSTMGKLLFYYII